MARWWGTRLVLLALVALVILLLEGRPWFGARGPETLAVWWVLYALPFVALVSAAVRPVRDGHSIRGYSPAAKAAVALISGTIALIGFLYYPHPPTQPEAGATSVPWAITLMALLLFALLWLVLRYAQTVEPLRLITVAPDGGFLIRFPNDPRLRVLLGEIGAAPTQEAGVWTAPPKPEVAEALLLLAKQHGFDFQPRGKTRHGG